MADYTISKIVLPNGDSCTLKDPNIQYNSYEFIKNVYNKSNYSIRGVDFTYSNGKYTANGTATGGQAYRLLSGGSTKLPDGMEAGKTYYFSFKCSDPSKVNYGIFQYIGSGTWNSLILIEGESGYLTIPSNTTGLWTGIFIQSGVTVENVVASDFKVFNVPSNEDLAKQIEELRHRIELLEQQI